MGTGEGLVCFSSPSDWEYKVYRREEGLTNTHIRAITEDANHNIWVSTNKGISCLLRDKDVFYNYDHWDNVPDRKSTRLNSSHPSSSRMPSSA